MIPPIVLERLNRFSPHFAAQFLLSKVQSGPKPRASRNDTSAADMAAATVKRKCWLDFRFRDSNLVSRQVCRQKNFQERIGDALGAMAGGVFRKETARLEFSFRGGAGKR